MGVVHFTCFWFVLSLYLINVTYSQPLVVNDGSDLSSVPLNSGSNSWYLSGSNFAISTTITVGAGQTLYINSNGQATVSCSASSFVAFAASGPITVERVTFKNCGKVFTTTATITLLSSSFIQNGIVLTSQAASSVYVHDSTFTSNTQGLHLSSTTNCTIASSDFNKNGFVDIVGNIINLAGGAIWMQSMTCSIINSQFVNNTGYHGVEGGALYINGGQVKIEDCSFSSNALYASGDTFGGGISARSGSQLTIKSTTFLSHSATYGGALYVANSNTLAISDSTFRYNYAGNGVVFMDTCTSIFSNSTFDSNTGVKGTLYLKGGTMGANSMTCKDNTLRYGDASGGCIYADSSSTISVTLSTITSNSANTGGGIYSEGQVVLTDTVLEANIATLNGGGGLYIKNGVLQLVGGSVTGNIASRGYGGGLYLHHLSSFSIELGLISNNAANYGGGLSFTACTNGLISECQISENTAAVSGAGVYMIDSDLDIDMCNLDYNNATGAAGGIYVTTSSLLLTNSTLFGNQASDSAGGIYLITSTLAASNLTCEYNAVLGSSVGGGCMFADSKTVVQISASIIASNSANTGGGILFSGMSLRLYDNLIESNSATQSVGGGVSITNGTLLLDTCTVTGNIAYTNGGGLYMRDLTSTKFIGTQISNNEASIGGGLSFYHCIDNTISDCHITSNTATTNGGGVYMILSKLEIDTSYVETNTARIGGGIHLTSTAIFAESSISLKNMVLVGNQASASGAGLYAFFSAINAIGLACHDNIVSAATLGGGCIFSDSATTVQISSSTIASNNGNIGGGIYFQGYSLKLAHVTVKANNATQSGGGLFLKNGDVDVSGCTITGNLASQSYGGGVYLQRVSSSNLANSLISNNLANYGGGLCFTSCIDDIISDCQITSNQALLNGGGVFMSESEVQIDWSNFEHNNANLGGAMYVANTAVLENPTFLLTNSTIIENYASNQAAGIYLLRAAMDAVNLICYNNTVASVGGCIFASTQSDLQITTSIISANTAGDTGAGILFAGTTLDLSNSTFQANKATQSGGALAIVSGAMTMTACVVSGNIAAESHGGGLYVQDSSATIMGTEVSSNDATFGGGLSFYSSTNSFVANCIIDSNTAEIDGGGVYITSSTVEIDLTIVQNNVAYGYGGGIHIFNNTASATNSSVLLMNNTLVGNQALYYSAIFAQVDTYALIMKDTFLDKTISLELWYCCGGNQSMLETGARCNFPVCTTCANLTGCDCPFSSSEMDGSSRIQPTVESSCSSCNEHYHGQYCQNLGFVPHKLEENCKCVQAVQYYYEAYPGVHSAGIDAIFHYENTGAFIGNTWSCSACASSPLSPSSAKCNCSAAQADFMNRESSKLPSDATKADAFQYWIDTVNTVGYEWNCKLCVNFVTKKAQNSTSFIKWLIPVLVVVVAAFIAGYLWTLRKRRTLIRQVAEKQRSIIDRENLALLTRVGRGASGEVWKGTYHGTDVAVKKIITTNVNKQVIEDFEMEVAIMCGLRHPNIILFMGSCYDAKSNEMFLVMEFMARGSLNDVIMNTNLPLSYEMKIHIACQAAQGMNFLHQSNPPTIHRDLKSHNILIDDKWNARISDFGIAKLKEDTKEARNGQSIGTVYWTAPEALQGVVTTEKSDCYSFGIVLWELFHNQAPYKGRDPVAVAVEVVRSGLRPNMASDVPEEIQDLIRACWAQEPAERPSMKEIMTTLRTVSLTAPLQHYTASLRQEAPTGLLSVVSTDVLRPYQLWEAVPRDMEAAMKLHNQVIRNNIDLYKGYEISFLQHSFTVAFTTVEDAANFAIAVQISLLHVEWPVGILQQPTCAPVYGGAQNTTLLWRGLRVRIAMNSGVPTCSNSSNSGRTTYVGPVLDKLNDIMENPVGTILISDSVKQELVKYHPTLIQETTTMKVGGSNAETIHQLIITPLSGRDSTPNPAPSELDDTLVEEFETLGVPSPSVSPRTLSSGPTNEASWIAHQKDIQVRSMLGKGSVGDYFYGTWNGKEVAIKVLVNQKLNEDDLFCLLGDSAYMSKFNNPNILQLYAVCVEPGNITLLSEFIPKGNLRALLSDSSVQLPFAKKVKIASGIAHGMAFLNSQPDATMRVHDSLKTNNIMIGNDWEAKIADYWHNNIRELARTMTSVGNIAWTAPEILEGRASCPQSSTYSFGIILWEIFTRQVPYQNEHPIRVLTKILGGYRPPIPADCPDAYKQLIEQCVHEDPLARPSWDTIIDLLSKMTQEY